MRIVSVPKYFFLAAQSSACGSQGFLLCSVQDGHVEVARLLLDSGAQVNMPADSFESPLTLAACGGHVELAALLIERGANLEEVNDEGYTPLMEAAREGHEEMVALLLAQGTRTDSHHGIVSLAGFSDWRTEHFDLKVKCLKSVL